MEKVELKEALVKGRPLAEQIEKLNKKYNSANKPELLSIIIIGILIALGSSENKIIMGVTYALFFRVLMLAPIMNLLYAGYCKLVGKVFFFKKQKKLLGEMNDILDNFIKITNLPDTYCDTEIINKFSYYLDHHLADNLKECATLYREDVKHQETLNEISEMRDELKREMKDLNDRTNGTTINRF